MRIDCWIGCVLILAASSLAAANSTPALPDGIDGDDWAQIQHQIQAQRFHAQAGDITGGWQAANPAHGFAIDYRPDGQTVLTLADTASAQHRIALQLQGYGYGDALIPLTEAPTMSANGNTVSYQWKEGLREWWINNEQGVAQWFELAERPAMDSNAQPLVVAMTLDTGLNASVADNALTLSASDNGTTITYDRLKVWDATGRVLPAGMALDGRQLALHVDDANAVYPVTIDPTFAQQGFLKASNSAGFDEFGWAVAIAGDTLVAGAPGEDSAADGVNGDPADNSASRAGAAYVFVRSGTGWSQQAYLKASNSGAGDEFGWSVAIAGDTVVVGARFEDSAATGVNGDPADNSAENAGAAYVFVRSGTSWSQQAYLKAANSDIDDEFGTSVAIMGDTVVVGAPFEDSAAAGVNGDSADNSANGAGAAYVFVRSGTSWSQQAYLKAANSGRADLFGYSIAIADDTVVVGARGEASTADGVNGDPADNSANRAGAAYVFVRSGTSWSQQAYLKAANSAAFDEFGTSVAIAGDTVVVGAHWEDSAATGVNGDLADNSAPDAGAAYVFVRSGTSWSQQVYLKASNSGADDEFGRSVAVAGDTVVVGARREDSDADGVNGDPADNSASNAGAAYVFVRSGTNWSEQAYLKASNSTASNQFGWSVAVEGHTVVVGAQSDNNSAFGTGAAYVFEIAYTVGGTVNGLAGTGLVLQNNGGDNLPITADGSFTFGTEVFDGSAYNVTVRTQPTDLSQTCTVTNGAGTVNGSTITDVEINCATNSFTIGGTANDLAGSGLMLQNNAGDDLPITANGAFTFDTALDDGSAYAVTISTQPTGPNQTCAVTNGSGTLNGADATNVQIECVTDTFTVGGTVTGLGGSGLVLRNNGGGDLAIMANGAFTFPTALADGSAYAVTVATQPTNLSQTCTVTNATGALAGANVTNVQIECVTDTFTVGGTVSDLSGTGLVLQNNGGDDLPITADGAFTFSTVVFDGSAYNVTVRTQPTDLSQTCTVTNGAGTLSGADITDVQVECVTDTFTVGGTVSGLSGTGLVLQNNAGDDLAITADGAFTFDTALDDGSAYAITVSTQPTDLSQTCTVSNATGTLAGADVTNVQIECVTNTFTVGGTVSGLNGTGLVLQNNAGDDLAITADGPFVFDTVLDDGSEYNITVLTQPGTARDQQCTVSNGSGTLAGADVSDVMIDCVDITLELSTGDLDLGLVFLGANGTATIIVTNTGTADLTLDGISTPADPFSLSGGSCLSVPVTLAAAETCSLDVRFSPTAAGTFSDQLVITSNAISSPDTITIRGNGSFEPLVVPSLNAWGLLILMLALVAIGGSFARLHALRC